MQAIYVFVYKQIHRNKVMFGSSQYSKHKPFVLSLTSFEIGGLLENILIIIALVSNFYIVLEFSVLFFVRSRWKKDAGNFKKF